MEEVRAINESKWCCLGHDFTDPWHVSLGSGVNDSERLQIKGVLCKAGEDGVQGVEQSVPYVAHPYITEHTDVVVKPNAVLLTEILGLCEYEARGTEEVCGFVPVLHVFERPVAQFCEKHCRTAEYEVYVVI